MALMQLLSICYQKTFESAATPHKHWIFMTLQLIQTRKVQFALWYFSAVSVLKQFIYELFCIDSLCFHLIVLSFYCQQLILHLSKFVSRQPLFYSLFFPLYFNFHASKNSEICVSEV